MPIRTRAIVWLILVVLVAAGLAPGLSGYGGSEGGFVLTFTNGLVRAGTRVDFFNLFIRDYADVVVPVSDVTRMFDGAGRCVGCR